LGELVKNPLTKPVGIAVLEMSFSALEALGKFYKLK
jgi:hypothetical protein